jgi:oligopeptidase B
VRMRPQFSSSVTASPRAEPQAEQRPLERTLHDLRLIDEYAWLRAENWREVMRDPLQLDPAIRAYLKPKTIIASARSPVPKACRKRCLPK